jgi:DNA-binding winged helix-turn-helix (wHTH) protein/Tfp pilus assembly protein PilF
MAVPDRHTFAEFTLERSQRRLRRRDGTDVPLTPRLFAALLMFVERADQLLDRETLLAALWPGLVVEENNLSQVVSGLRRALGDDGGTRRFIETVPRQGFRFVAEVTPLTNDPKLTLAVLPFVPLSLEERNVSLELGMADSLIARLSTVAGLVVRSVGSLRRFIGPEQDALAAARLLDVAWIVDGSLQRQGDRMRITARLLSAADGTAAWTGQFDEHFVDVFTTQDAIAARVAATLCAQLVQLGGRYSASSAPADIGGTRDSDAYQLYLGARQHAQTVRADGLRRSIDMFGQALACDPQYALAYAGLAESYRRLIFGADWAPADVFPLYRSAVMRALEIAPDLAEAHAQLGWIHFWNDFEWLEAERVFRHAIALNSNAVSARFGLGFLLLTLGRVDEGMAQMSVARELDPLSLIINTMSAAFAFGAGRREEARQRIGRVLQIDSSFWVAHMTRAWFLRTDGDNEGAIAAMAQADVLADGSSQAAAVHGAWLAQIGRSDEARAVLLRLERQSETRYVPPTSLAAIHAGLGESALALDALEKAFLCRDTRMAYLRDDPRWTSLNALPRFRELLHLMRLDDNRKGVSGP